MAAAIKEVSLGRGRDPRDHVLVSLGGAGALHAFELAPLVGIEKVLIPPFASVASAFGATTMDIRHEVDQTFYMPCTGADLSSLNDTYRGLEDKATRILEDEGFDREAMELTRTAAMRYVGQSYEVGTAVPQGELDEAALSELIDSFHKVHHREYGVSSTEFSVAFVSLRVIGSARIPAQAKPTVVADQADGNLRETSRRKVYFGQEFVDTAVFAGADLGSGDQLVGPAVAHYPHGDVIIAPGMECEVDDAGNLLLKFGQGAI